MMPVSTIVEPVSDTMMPVSTIIGGVASVLSITMTSLVSLDSVSFCGKKTSSEIQSSIVFMKRSRFSHPSILTIGSSGYTYSDTDSSTDRRLIRDNDIFATRAHDIGLPRFREPETIVREPV